MKNFTTLCYIEKDDKYLMMHRVSKKNDINKEKWIGIGGHFETGESPEECLLREVAEETGLTLKSYKFRGLITFLTYKESSGDKSSEKEISDAEYMALYTAETDENIDIESVPYCDEGVLQWIEKEKVFSLNLWEGDRIFFRLLRDRKEFFSLKLSYEGNTLIEAVLDGKPMELFDIRNEKGERTGLVRERNLVHENGDLHGTVHIWVYRENNGIPEILLQKRSDDKDSFPGCFDISSAGHIQAGDDFEVSAVRELEEELGIYAKPEELQYMGFHRGTSESEFWGRRFINNEISKMYLYKLKDTDTIELQKSEVQDILWITIEECMAELDNPEFKHCLFKDELEVLKNRLERKGSL